MKKKILAGLLLALSLGVPAAASVLPQDYSYNNGGMNQWESDVYFFNRAYPEKIALLESNVSSLEGELVILERTVSDLEKKVQVAAEADKAPLEAELSQSARELGRSRKGLLLMEGEIEKLAKDKEHLENRVDLSFEPVLLRAAELQRAEAQELLAERYIRPTTGYESSPYGWRIHPVTGLRSMHNGIDLANAEGTPIYAARSGVVKSSGYNDISGNNLLVRHYDGQETAYYHMSKLIAVEGQFVLQGDVIGLMGTTGRSTGSHLHFEIRIHGERVDPAAYIYQRTRWEQR